MFRTRLAAVILSGGLMLVSGCMQLPQGQGLFGRRPFSDPCCCHATCGDCGCPTSYPMSSYPMSSPNSCGCGNLSGTVISQAPTVVPQEIYPMPQSYPLPRITTTPNSPMVPYQGH